MGLAQTERLSNMTVQQGLSCVHIMAESISFIIRENPTAHRNRACSLQ